MFQAVCRRILPNNRNLFGGLQLLRFNSTSLFNDTRDVELIGTIHLKPITLKDGSKILSIKTNKSESVYNVHRARIQSPALLNVVKDNLSIGQRVFVKGELRASTYKNAENKLRQSFQVRVNEIYASNADKTNTSESTTGIDHNSICIVAYMSKDVFHFANHSVLNLVSHRTAWDDEGGEKTVTEYFTAYVQDKNLIEMLKKDLQRRGRLLINGYLKHSKDTDTNGKSCINSHIEATNILKVDFFPKSYDNVHIGNDATTADG